MDKASLECIKRLLEIIEAEPNHELLLSVKNLRELGASPFLYIVLVIPRSFPKELVKGEHFVLIDLLQAVKKKNRKIILGQIKADSVGFRWLCGLVGSNR